MRILLFINNKFTIFANRLTTNEDMNRTGTIYNTLNMRGLQELPPPICRNYINKYRLGTEIHNSHRTLVATRPPAASGLCLLRQGSLVFVAKSCAERRNAY